MAATINPRILSLATATPQHRISQSEARELARVIFRDVLSKRGFRDPERAMSKFLRPFQNSGIRYRNFCVPAEWFVKPRAWAEKNALYQQHGAALAAEAVRSALDRAEVSPEDVGTVVFVSSTGISTPSLGSNLLEDVGIPETAFRHTSFGLGCAAGANGLRTAARLAEPGELTLLVALELCSLTWLREDVDSEDLKQVKAALISSVLFSDGAAAVVVGHEGDGPEVLGGHSTTWRSTRHVMGWRTLDAGLGVILDADIPRIVREKAIPSLKAACASQGLSLGDLDHLVLHPGGAKVLDAFEEGLGLEPGSLALSREVLRDHGNMSSATVLFVLERLLDGVHPTTGEHGVVSALGPGFSAEHAFLRF